MDSYYESLQPLQRDQIQPEFLAITCTIVRAVLAEGWLCVTDGTTYSGSARQLEFESPDGVSCVSVLCEWTYPRQVRDGTR